MGQFEKSPRSSSNSARKDLNFKNEKFYVYLFLKTETTSFIEFQEKFKIYDYLKEFFFRNKILIARSSKNGFEKNTVTNTLVDAKKYSFDEIFSNLRVKIQDFIVKNL